LTPKNLTIFNDQNQSYLRGAGSNLELNLISPFICRINQKDVLENKWPSLLTVEELSIHGPLDLNSITNLSAIDCNVKRVTLKECPILHIYTLLEKLGYGISHLTISSSTYIGCTKQKSVPDVMNLYRVFAACPNIERFKLWGFDGHFETTPTFNLTPHHFRNCER